MGRGPAGGMALCRARALFDATRSPGAATGRHTFSPASNATSPDYDTANSARDTLRVYRNALV